MEIFIIIVICFFIIYCLDKYIQKKSIINSNKNKKYIFSYGSLLNMYVQKVLLKNIKTLPPKAILSKESGYKRLWIEGSGGISLGVFQTNNPDDINGVILEFDESKYINFKKYETNETQHYIKKISWDHIKVKNKSAYKNSDLYIYVVKGFPKRASIVEKMPNLYAQTVMDGFNRYGEDYLDLFLSTTG